MSRGKSGVRALEGLLVVVSAGALAAVVFANVIRVHVSAGADMGARAVLLVLAWVLAIAWALAAEQRRAIAWLGALGAAGVALAICQHFAGGFSGWITLYAVGPGGAGLGLAILMRKSLADDRIVRTAGWAALFGCVAAAWLAMEPGMELWKWLPNDWEVSKHLVYRWGIRMGEDRARFLFDTSMEAGVVQWFLGTLILAGAMRPARGSNDAAPNRKTRLAPDGKQRGGGCSLGTPRAKQVLAPTGRNRPGQMTSTWPCADAQGSRRSRGGLQRSCLLRPARVLLFAAALLLYASVALTYSRAGLALAGLSLGLGFIMMLRSRKAAIMSMACGVILLVVAAFAANRLASSQGAAMRNVASIFDPSEEANRIRIEQLRSAGDELLDTPWHGRGAASFVTLSQAPRMPAHESTPVGLVAAFGVGGAALVGVFAGLLVMQRRRLLQPILDKTLGEHSAAARLVVMLVPPFACYSLVAPILSSSIFGIIGFSAAGMLVVRDRRARLPPGETVGNNQAIPDRRKVSASDKMGET